MRNNLKKLIWGIFPIFNNLFNLIIIKLISYITTIEEFGRFNLIKSMILLVGPIVTLGLPQAIIRFLPENSEKKKSFIKQVTKASKLLFLILASFSACIIFILRKPLNLEFVNLTLNIVLMIYIYLQNYGMIINSIDRAELNLKKYNLYTLLVNLISMCVFILMYKYLDSILSYFLSYSITYLIINKIYSIKLNKNNNAVDENNENRFLIKNMIRYGLPLIAINISAVVLNIGDRFILNIISTSTDLGIYSGIYSVANGIWTLLFMVISTYVYPIYMKLYKQYGKRAVSEFLISVNNILINISIGAVVFLFIFNKFVVQLFLNEKYLGNIILLLLLFIGNVLYGVYYLISSEYYITQNTSLLARGVTLAGILNIIFNIILIPLIGIVGAAVSTILSYIILAYITYIKQDLMKLSLDKIMLIKNLCLLFIIYIISNVIGNKGFILLFTMLVVYLSLFSLWNLPYIKKLLN